MANCSNCGAVLSCGCQRKTASDGKVGCVQCIPAYEQKLKKEKAGGKLPDKKNESNGVMSNKAMSNGTVNSEGRNKDDFSFGMQNFIMN